VFIFSILASSYFAMENQNDVPTAADGEKVDLNILRLNPDQLEFLEIIRDSAVMRSNESFVLRKPADIVTGENLTACNEQAPTASRVQTLNPALQQPVAYRRRKKNTFKSSGNIVLLEAIAKSLRSAAIRRSLNFVLSVPTFTRATRFVVTAEQTKIIAATILSPVPEPTTMICPRPVDINVVDENLSAVQIDESEDRKPKANKRRRRTL